MPKKKSTTTTTTDTTVEPTLSFQSAPADKPVATTEAPATGQVVSGLSPEEIREAEDLKFWRQQGRNAITGEAIATGSIGNMAVMLFNRSNDHGLDVAEWIDLNATKLPAPIRVWHRALIADLEDAGYSKPPMMWKRIKERVLDVVKETRKATGEGEGEPEVEQVESAREKLRRLCEEDIQKLYSRLQKARVSVEKEADIDLLALLPALRDMAETIGYKLTEPSAK